MIFTVLTEEVTEALRLDIAQGLFSLIITSIIETEAIPATGITETIIGTETTTGIETEAGIEVTIAIEIGTITVIVAELKTGITTEIITTAEIRDHWTIETIAVVEILDLWIVETMEVVENLDQMIAEATQEVGEVEVREAMLPVLHLSETEIVEQKLQALHPEVVRIIGERRFKLQDHQPKALTMDRVEVVTVEEEACQIEVKPTIRVGEGLISDKKKWRLRSPFFC